MKISCTPISLGQSFRDGKMTMESFVTFCAEQKLDGVDITDSLSYPWSWKGYDKKRSEIAKHVEKCGLKVAAYACGNNFSLPSEEELKKNVDKVRNAVEEAVEVGAPVVRIFGGYHPDCGGDKSIDYSNGFEWVLRGFEACLPIAEKHRMVLAIENHGRIPGHPYEILAIMDRFRSPWLKVTFDAANFLANNMDEPADPLKALERLAPYVAHVHVKDLGLPVVDKTRKNEACVCGKGFVPLRQFVGGLEAVGYTGYCALEYEANHVVPEAEGVPQSFDYLRRIRAIHQVLQKQAPALKGGCCCRGGK